MMMTVMQAKTWQEPISDPSVLFIMTIVSCGKKILNVKIIFSKMGNLILRKKMQRFLSTVTLKELCTIGKNCLLILNALLMACLNIAIITFCSRHLQIYTLSTSVSKTTSHSYSSCKIHTVQLPQLVPAEWDFALSILVRTLGAHLRESQRACLFPLFWWINAPMGVSFVIQMTSTELNWFLMRKFEKWNSFMKGKYMIFHAASATL